MAYDLEIADRVRECLAAERVVEKRMFGGLAFLLDGNTCVAASGKGGLMVRHDPTTEFAEPGVAPMEMGGRGPMKGWLRVDPSVLDDATLVRWVGVGVAYARSLPPK